MQDVPTIEKKVRQPTKKLPTDRLAFDKQIALLRGWVAASGATGKAVGNKEVAEIVKMASSRMVCRQTRRLLQRHRTDPRS